MSEAIGPSQTADPHVLNEAADATSGMTSQPATVSDEERVRRKVDGLRLRAKTHFKAPARR